eukprot:GEMP01106741.1.p1 GENE.GEMP01106741.1~~GEMP01106741.1.p1  ORF type:complete len:234 (+),score=56.56 GEMP01106741.1:57-704(+)
MWMFIFSVCVTVSAFGARELTEADFDEITGHRAFVKFFAPWCGHCKRIKSTWHDLEKEYLGSPIVTIADVDCTRAGKPICDRIGVRGFPTLKYFINGEARDYKGGRNLAELKHFVKKTFPAVCVPDTGEGCADEEKKVIKQYLGKDLVKELATLESDKTAQAVEFTNIEIEFKAEQDRLRKVISVLKLMDQQIQEVQDVQEVQEVQEAEPVKEDL